MRSFSTLAIGCLAVGSAVLAWSMSPVRAAEPVVAQLELRRDTERVEVFQRDEIQVVGMPAAVNPFDPDEVALDLYVQTPSGAKLHVPGFFHREFTRDLSGNREILTPRSDGEWRVRWLPLEPGLHALTVIASLVGRAVGQCEVSVEVSDSARPGLVRVEPTSKRYFCLDDGRPLFLNGLCVGWHGRRGTYDYDDWLKAYRKAGINYMRIWMYPVAFGIEWDRQDRLQYRMDAAWQLDRVLAEAERSGVFVMLCLDYHGIFEVKPDFWGTNNYWPRHPYNAANGGPCQTQNDFFTNEQAKQLYEKRLRYLVARWSAFPNLFAWEFFNEIDNEYAYVKHEDVIAWHGEMGRRLRQLDPYDHLISSSFTGGSERPDLFALSEMDFSQYHSYNERHPAQMTAEKTDRFYRKYKKPFFVSEYGTDWKGWKPDTDPHFRALHQAIWSGVFTGAAGTGMTWWWESIHSANLYHHWSALSTFLKGSGVGSGDMQPARFQDIRGPVSCYGVAAPTEALVWLLDRNFDWPEGALVEDPPAVRDAAATLTDVEDGLWTIEWLDTLSGQLVLQAETTATNGVLHLEVPAFQIDVAGRLRKK